MKSGHNQEPTRSEHFIEVTDEQLGTLKGALASIMDRQERGTPRTIADFGVLQATNRVRWDLIGRQTFTEVIRLASERNTHDQPIGFEELAINVSAETGIDVTGAAYVPFIREPGRRFLGPDIDATWKIAGKDAAQFAATFDEILVTLQPAPLLRVVQNDELA